MVRENDIERRVRLGRVKYSRQQGFYDLGDLLYLGSIGSSLRVYCDYIENTRNENLSVYVLDFSVSDTRPQMVMDLFLSRCKSLFGLPTYAVGLVCIDDAYQGFNLAPTVYAYLLKRFDGWILRSGASQSPGGKAIWNTLCRQKGISVYACNSSGRQMHPCRYDPDGIDCDVDVYAKGTSYYLYATRT